MPTAEKPWEPFSPAKPRSQNHARQWPRSSPPHSTSSRHQYWTSALLLCHPPVRDVDPTALQPRFHVQNDQEFGRRRPCHHGSTPQNFQPPSADETRMWPLLSLSPTSNDVHGDTRLARQFVITMPWNQRSSSIKIEIRSRKHIPCHVLRGEQECDTNPPTRGPRQAVRYPQHGLAHMGTETPDWGVPAIPFSGLVAPFKDPH